MTPAHGRLHIGLLVSDYPALSHAFIEREVRALRARGVHVATFSIRPAAAAALRTDRDLKEAASTRVLRGTGPGTWAFAVLDLVVRAPRSLGVGVSTALRTGPREPRARLWQLFYLAQAVLLYRMMRQTRIRHLHVHLANNAADIARLAVTLGNAREPGTFSWSLAMHGPTELADVTRFDLAAKVRSAAFVACITDFCRSQLMTLVEPAHWENLYVVRMGVELDRYPPRAAERAERAAPHSPPGVDPLRVLFVGRLVPEKGPYVLLDALDILEKATPDGTKLVMVGGGPMADTLAKRVADLGLTGAVQLLGPLGQDDIPGWHAWADCLCLPSFAEGLPVVLMEAMASELPVVTTAIAGIPELVQDNRNGLVLPPGRADLLAAALVGLRDPRLRRRLGETGRLTVAATYTPDVNAAVLEPLLERYAQRTNS